MTNVNKTVAERLREKSNVDHSYDACGHIRDIVGLGWCGSSTCHECQRELLPRLADIIEAEKAEFAERCANAAAERMANTMKSKTIDVDALNSLAAELRDNYASKPSYERFILTPQTAARWFMTIREATRGANPSKSGELPEGVEWPRFEDGELVKFGDRYSEWGKIPVGHEDTVSSIHFKKSGFRLNGTHDKYTYNYGEFVKRPEPEVLDADGAPIKVGDTVWNISTGKKYEVLKLPRKGSYQSVMVRGEDGADGFDPDRLTHRKPDTLEDVQRDAEEFVKSLGDGRNAMYVFDLLERTRKLMGGE